MRRAVTVTVVLAALAGAAGCGRGDAGGPAGPAGRVVELEGSVSAIREGQASRPLHDGDPIFPDDTVETADRAEVTILLSHNGARWSLGGGKTRRVDRSPAWRAEPGQRSGSAFDDDEALPTSSAGRHSEPQVGDTRATAPARAQDTAPEAEAETRVAKSAPKRRTGGKRSEERGARLDQAAGGGAASPSTEAAPGAGIALGAIPARPAAKGGALAVSGGPRARLGALTVKGSRKKREIAADVARLVGAAAKLCAMDAPAGTVKLRFAIGRKGDVTGVRVTGAAAVVGKVGSCLEKQIGEATFAARREGTTQVSQSVRFEVP